MREGPGMIGNIRNTPLHEVLDSEAARSLRRRLTTADMPSACGHCAMQIAENQQIDRILAGCAD
jgi:hypothetical protein